MADGSDGGANSGGRSDGDASSGADRSDESAAAERGNASDAPLGARIGRRVLPGAVRRRYALKFALSLGVVILVIAAVGVGSYVQTRAIVEDDAEETLRSTAALQADSVSQWMARMEAHARGIAGAGVFAGGGDGRSGAPLVHGSPDVAGIHYVDASGTVAASTSADLAGASVSAARPQWRGPMSEAAVESSGGPTVGVSDRAYESNGRLLMAFAIRAPVREGVLVVVGDVDRGIEQLSRSGPVDRTQLLSADGANVLAPRRDRPSALADTEEFAAALDGATVVRERGDGVVAFAPVEGTEWVVATEASESRLYQASRTVGRYVAALVAASVATLAAVGFALGRGTVRPLARLRRRAEAMEAGDLDVDLTTHREDEIGRLFAAFDSTRAALRDQIREATEARERAERSRRELARQNERLDQFASTVSHDLRNPLNVADGHVRLLDRRLADLDGLDDGDAARLREHVAKIEASHDRMTAIVEDVLALARQGRDIEETETVDLAAVAEEAWATVDSGDATCTVTESRPVEADPDRLRQAFENLFRNAVEHGTPDDGATGDAPPVAVEVGLTETGFYVADDGPGIPSDAGEDVFEYGHTTSEDGTGFGLAIVETVVTAHGWEIAVDESREGGAKFVVSGVFAADE